MTSPSIGDIVLCSQIAYRLLTAATIGRRDAPRDLRELDGVLLAMNCSLSHLHEVAAGISPQNMNLIPGIIDVQQNLGLMVRSCRQVLEDLEKSTVKYRDTIQDPTSAESSDHPGTSRRAKFRSQWRRFMWDLRGESLTRYRQKLETHIAAINLMLSTCIWCVQYIFSRLAMPCKSSNSPSGPRRIASRTKIGAGMKG